MNYDRADLLDRLAAEYVFGTLTGRARRRFERLRQSLPAAERAVREWEARLMPLSEPVPPVIPGQDVWTAIDRRTGATRAESASGRWSQWWKPALGIAFGVVATLGLVRLYPSAVVPIDELVQERGTLPQSYVGLLTDRDGAPVVLASSTRHGTKMTFKILKPIDVPPGKVLQLWALPREGAPFPVGLVPPRDKGEITMADTSEKLLSNVPRLAVSIEDRPAVRGDVPSPYILSGHCVKLW